MRCVRSQVFSNNSRRNPCFVGLASLSTARAIGLCKDIGVGLLTGIATNAGGNEGPQQDRGGQMKRKQIALASTGVLLAGTLAACSGGATPIVAGSGSESVTAKTVAVELPKSDVTPLIDNIVLTRIDSPYDDCAFEMTWDWAPGAKEALEDEFARGIKNYYMDNLRSPDADPMARFFAHNVVSLWSTPFIVPESEFGVVPKERPDDTSIAFNDDYTKLKATTWCSDHPPASSSQTIWLQTAPGDSGKPRLSEFGGFTLKLDRDADTVTLTPR